MTSTSTRQAAGASLHTLPTAAAAAHTDLPRNPGIKLDLGWLEEMRHVNRSALERRATTLTKRRSIKADNQAAWLLRAISLMDLTTLNSNDTDERVRRLCAKARSPLRADLLAGLGLGDTVIRPAAVCVYHPFVATAVKALEGTDIHVAAVSTAFPHGLSPLETRIAEIRASVAVGADEIDVVIPRGLVLGAKWQELYDEVAQFREACGEAHLKVILGTGELSTLRNVMLASMVSMMAGADFIKTSTGKVKVNATLEAAEIMLTVIEEIRREGGPEIGFKPAGGIRTLADAGAYIAIADRILGANWVAASHFRFGASGLLDALLAALDGREPTTAKGY